MDAARARRLPAATLRFDLDGYSSGRLSDVEALRGQAGWLRVTRLTVKAAGETATHLLLAAITDAGQAVPEPTLDRLFLVPAAQWPETEIEPPDAALEQAASALRDGRLKQAEAANGAWMELETGKLDAYAADMERAADAEIKALEAEVRARRKALRVAGDIPVTAKIEEQRAIKKLDARRDELMLTRFERKRTLQRDIEDILDQVQASLAIAPVVEPVFKIRWEVA